MTKRQRDNGTARIRTTRGTATLILEKLRGSQFGPTSIQVTIEEYEDDLCLYLVDGGEEPIARVILMMGRS